MEKIIALIIVKLTWALTYILPVKKNKITFISYFNDELSGDFLQIVNEIKRRNKGYKIVLLLKKFNNSLLDKVLYLFHFIIQTYHINTSSVVLLDGNNFPVCNIKKKKSTKVVQIWHACGAIKKFGCDINRRFEIKNYDYLYVAGKPFIKTFSSAFQMDTKHIIPLGMPKTDVLYDKEILSSYKAEMYTKYPQLEGKKVVLYAPTFRGDGAFDKKYVDLNLEYISEQLGDEYIILYKMHPFLDSIRLSKETGNIINVSKLDLYKIFSVADVLISDYSAIIFDFSILERPIVLYVPDLEKYEAERGFYYDYKEFAPGPICRNEKDLVEVLKTRDLSLDKVRDMKYKYFDFHDGKSTIRVVDDIEQIMGEF